MAFTPKAWQDEPLETTAINAAALVDLEQRLANYTDSRSVTVPYQVLYPSGDTSGAVDDANFAAACVALPNGGVIYLVANSSTPFYTKNTAGTYTGTGWSPPQQTQTGSGGGPVCIQGIGWPELRPVGAAVTGFYAHRTANYNTPGDHNPGGYIRDVVVDGSSATGASKGIDAGDAFAQHIRAVVKNFTGSGAIGFHNANRVFFTEKCNYEIQSYNNSIAAKTAQIGVSDSHEYNRYDLVIWATTADQDGFRVTSGMGGCDIRIRGNMVPTSAPVGTMTGTLTSGATTVTSLTNGTLTIPAVGTVLNITGTGIPAGATITITNSTSGTGTGTLSANATASGAQTLTTAPTGNAAMLSVTGSNGNITHAQVWARVEINTGGTGNNPYSIYSDGVGKIANSSGQFGNGANMFQANMNGAECSFSGPMVQSAQPGWPANNGMSAMDYKGGNFTTIPTTGTQWNNQGPDAIVSVTGGTVSNIRVNTTHGLNLTSGAFYVAAGGFLTVFYTVAPTISIAPVSAA